MGDPSCLAGWQQAERVRMGVGGHIQPEQRKLGRLILIRKKRMSVVEELESVVTANLQRATRLRQSILQKAFTGELS